MEYKASIRQITAMVVIAIGGLQAGCAQELNRPAVQQVPAQTQPAAAASAASAAASTSVSAPVSASAVNGIALTSAPALSSDAPTPEEAQQNVRGNVAELQDLIQGGQLTEMRTTYNGSYGATLLFNPKDVTYYVGLFQQKTFWRVIKTTEDFRANAIYRGFVGETERLSEPELHRIKLEGQKTMTEQLLRVTQDQQSRLQADLNVARRQQAVVADQQQRERTQVDTLQAQNAQARRQLADLKREVHKLQNDVDYGGLPTAKH
jgi:hypothetical protein